MLAPITVVSVNRTALRGGLDPEDEDAGSTHVPFKTPGVAFAPLGVSKR
jgi:hypothetical protein